MTHYQNILLVTFQLGGRSFKKAVITDTFSIPNLLKDFGKTILSIMSMEEIEERIKLIHYK